MLSCFQKTFNLHLDGNIENFKKELEAVKNAGGKVSNALEISAYARTGRHLLMETILDIAKNGEYTDAVCMSHGPWAELASVNTEEADYYIPEATAVIYTVSSIHGIIASEYMYTPYQCECKK